MKKLLVLAASAGLVFSGAAAVTANVLNTPVVETKAEAAGTSQIITEEVDVTGKTKLRASEGSFIKVANPKTSGLGLYMEFKVANPENTRRQVIRLQKNGVDASGNIYLLDVSDAGGVAMSSYGAAVLDRTPGRRDVVSLADGWMKYEVMFADAGINEGVDYIDGINLSAWGDASNIVAVRNIKITDQTTYLGMTPCTYEDRGGDGQYLKGYGVNRQMPAVANWKTSGKGVSFEFKPAEGRDFETLIQFKEQPNSWATVSSGSIYMYRPGNTGTATCGKTITLADGWYRYEAMFADVPCVDGKETSTVSILYFGQWANDVKYGCRPTIRNVKLISFYSSAAETEVGDYATNVMNNTAAVCVADGSTDQEALTETVAALKTRYNTLAPQSKILTVYPENIVGADQKTIVERANARLGYIFAKYPSIANYTPVPVTAAYGTSFLFNGNSTSEYYVVAAVGGVALLAAGGLIFSRKKKHN